MIRMTNGWVLKSTLKRGGNLLRNECEKDWVFSLVVAAEASTKETGLSA